MWIKPTCVECDCSYNAVDDSLWCSSCLEKARNNKTTLTVTLPCEKCHTSVAAVLGNRDWFFHMKLCVLCRTDLNSYADKIEARRIREEDRDRALPTLRDKIAIAALSGHCIASPTSATFIADQAYRIADAMLERSKK